MTRKDYLLLSSTIASAHAFSTAEARVGVALLAMLLADKLAQETPCFDKHRFLKDAGVAP